MIYELNTHNISVYEQNLFLSVLGFCVKKTPVGVSVWSVVLCAGHGSVYRSVIVSLGPESPDRTFLPTLLSIRTMCVNVVCVSRQFFRISIDWQVLKAIPR